MQAANLISAYLSIGMSHMTKEGRDAINEIVEEAGRFQTGDRVCKTSNKPFKSALKINTIRGFMLNPHTKKVALMFNEDNSIVDAHQCEVVK